ncbi:MAG: hypothetical protein ABW178_13375, partial [Pseudoxanthomonas sp.]
MRARAQRHYQPGRPAVTRAGAGLPQHLGQPAIMGWAINAAQQCQRKLPASRIQRGVIRRG